MEKVKVKALEQKFQKETKENVRYFRGIETDYKDLTGKLWDFKNRSRQDNLRFDGMAEYEYVLYKRLFVI